MYETHFFENIYRGKILLLECRQPPYIHSYVHAGYTFILTSSSPSDSSSPASCNKYNYELSNVNGDQIIKCFIL